MIMTVNVHPHALRRKKKKPAPAIDRLVYVAVIGAPLMTLPQVYTIWVDRQGGVSMLSWIAYMVTGLIWLFYGIKHREWPIILVQIAWIILDLGVIIGLLML